jgi:hypothetical protein
LIWQLKQWRPGWQETQLGRFEHEQQISLSPGFFSHNWRIIMNSPTSMKTLSRRLILISAAILINANTVLAADRIGDAQIQARDLLSGTVGGRSKIIDKSLAISADQKSYPDPQEQARQLVLGKPSFDGPVSRELAALSARRDARVHTDPLELARRMILGREGSARESAGMRLSGIQEAKK